MTYKQWLKLRTLNTRLLQPTLPICSVDIKYLLDQILFDHFPEITQPPSIFFASIPFLAFIESARSAEDRTIWLHDCLNSSSTPDFVYSFILKHELLHAKVPPREVDGKWKSHPAEFFVEENRICGDEKTLSWTWLSKTFDDALVRDADLECIRVNNRKIQGKRQNKGI